MPDKTSDDETEEERIIRLANAIPPPGKPRSEWTDEEWDAFAEFYADEHGYAVRWAVASRRLKRRQKIYQRDGWRCVACGIGHDLTLDHILPKSKGGTDALDNLQTMCRTCNQAKRDAPTIRSPKNRNEADA